MVRGPIYCTRCLKREEMKEIESNNHNAKVLGPSRTTWPPPWLAERPTPPAKEPPAAPLPAPVDTRPTLALSTLPAAGLATVTAKIDLIRRRHFAGRLPDSLKRVATIYSDLASEYLARGQSIDGILESIDIAVVNALALEREEMAPAGHADKPGGRGVTSYGAMGCDRLLRHVHFSPTLRAIKQ
jgi:hypothetical protein